MKLSAALLGDNAASATSAGQCLSAVAAYAQSGQVDTDGIVWNDQAAYYHIAFEADDEEDAVEDEAADQDAEADEEQKEEGGDRLRRRLQDEEKEEQEENDEEQAAAEATIFDQMQGLAEALGIDIENDQAQQEGEEGEEEANAEAQQYQDLTYVMAYDEELADALGIEDRETFAKFYDLTYKLANQGGCSAGRRLQEDDGEEENDAEEDNNDEDADNAEEDGEGDADEDAAEEMEGDLIENILMNCQDSYEAIGINLEEIEEDGKSSCCTCVRFADMCNLRSFGRIQQLTPYISTSLIHLFYSQQTSPSRTSPFTSRSSRPSPTAS